MSEPRNGADILAELNGDIKLIQVRRPRMAPGWRVTIEGGSTTDVTDWNSVMGYLKTVGATLVDTSEI